MADVLISLFLVCIVPNVALWLLFGRFQRGFLNLEFAALTTAYILSRRWYFLPLIVVTLTADLFAGISRTFFFSIWDALADLPYLALLPIPRLVGYALALIAYFAVASGFVWYGSRMIRRRRACALFIVAVCVGFLACALLGGQYRWLGGVDVQSPRKRIVRVPTGGVLCIAIMTKPRNKPVASSSIDSPLAHLLSEDPSLLASARPNVAMITIESWGLMRNEELRNALTSSLLSGAIEKRYTVELGSVPFSGNTIYGESRDLCGKLFAQGPGHESAATLGACYPARFAASGYETIGIHGFYEHMYARERWFPEVGFHTSLFLPDLTNLGMRTCSFGLAGTCDSDVVPYLRNQLRSSTPNHPEFVHWMTLDSHLPVNVPAVQLAPGDCDASGLSHDEALCGWYTLIRRLNESIASLALDPTIRPTVFVLSGDHAPPFYSAERRALFSQNRVPYVILRPRPVS